MSFLPEDVMNLGSLENFDVVFLASLVGMSSHEKTHVLRNVCSKMKNGALLCARSAAQLRSLLYPVIEFDGEVKECGLELVLEMRPWNHIVNSTLIMRVER
jgi:nicotianamine synthase